MKNFNYVYLIIFTAFSNNSFGADTYDGKYLTIPKVLVPQETNNAYACNPLGDTYGELSWCYIGGVIYSDVIATIKKVIEVNDGLTKELPYDVYYPGTNQLEINTVTYEDSTYSNVVIELGDVTSVSSEQVASPRTCGTPGWDYVVTLGDYTMSTNLWGIRGDNTWVNKSGDPWAKWLEEDFEMCVQAEFSSEKEQAEISAIFDWSWPNEEYRDNRPITKDFTTIHYTPDGKPMTPVSVKNSSIVFHHDLSHVAISEEYNQNHQTFYDLYLSKVPIQLTKNTSSNTGGNLNISIRVYSSTGYVPGNGITDIEANIDGLKWIVRTGNNFVQFMAAENEQDVVGDLKLKSFIEYLKTKNSIPSIEDYYLHSIELGNEQIAGAAILKILGFHVKQ